MSPTLIKTDDSSPTSIRCLYSNNPFTHLDIPLESHYRFSSTYDFRNHNAIEQLYPFPTYPNDCRARHGMEDLQDYRSGSGKESCVGVVICICYSGGRTMIYSFYSPRFLSLLLAATLEKSIPAMTVTANPPITCGIKPVPLSSGLDHPESPLTSRGDLGLNGRGPPVVDPPRVLDTFRHEEGACRNGNFAPESWTSTLATPPKKSVTRVSCGEIGDNSVETPGWDFISPGS
jgi:hypothetical protein